MNAVAIIGEEVFTEYFEDLAGMYTYTLNTMITNDCNIMAFEQTATYECFEKVMPFLMNVLAHIILQHDDTEGPMNADWISANSPDYFMFDFGFDVMEILQTMEIMFSISEG